MSGADLSKADFSKVSRDF
ncbi:hypothetical protein [Methylocapsa polymorpha]